MKNSAIREMFYGKRGNYEKIKQSEEYRKLSNEFRKYDERLQKELSCEILELYEKVMKLFSDMNSEEIETIFEEGFSFGLLIGVQASEIGQKPENKN